MRVDIVSLRYPGKLTKDACNTLVHRLIHTCPAASAGEEGDPMFGGKGWKGITLGRDGVQMIMAIKVEFREPGECKRGI